MTLPKSRSKSVARGRREAFLRGIILTLFAILALFILALELPTWSHGRALRRLPSVDLHLHVR